MPVLHAKGRDQHVDGLAHRDLLGAKRAVVAGADQGEFRKYRVGDYRIIANIEDDALRILVVRIGYRRSVYRK